MNLKVKIILSLFISLILVIPIYILLHEGGHSLIAVLCGAKITKFSILGAYMSYEGGSFTPITLSLSNVAGMLLPVLAAVVYMLAYRNQAASILYRIFSFLFVLVPTGSILAWVLVPVYIWLVGHLQMMTLQNLSIIQGLVHGWYCLLPLYFSLAAFLSRGRKRSSKGIGKRSE